MKKSIILSFVFIFIIGLTSCKDDDPVAGAYIEVTVKNALGVAQTGTSVYMYKDEEVTSSTTPGDSEKLVVTDDNGIAKFSLNLFDLNIIENQTTLYFAVFYTVGNETLPAGSVGVTVKKGSTRNVSITIPI